MHHDETVRHGRPPRRRVAPVAMMRDTLAREAHARTGHPAPPPPSARLRSATGNGLARHERRRRRRPAACGGGGDMGHTPTRRANAAERRGAPAPRTRLLAALALALATVHGASAQGEFGMIAFKVDKADKALSLEVSVCAALSGKNLCLDDGGAHQLGLLVDENLNNEACQAYCETFADVRRVFMMHHVHCLGLAWPVLKAHARARVAAAAPIHARVHGVQSPAPSTAMCTCVACCPPRSRCSGCRRAHAPS